MDNQVTTPSKNGTSTTATGSHPIPMSRLPQGYRVRKRPILRPQIPSPYTNAKQAKCVYVSARSPFISTVKRVRKLQEQIVKRALGKITLVEDDVVDNKGVRSDLDKLKQITAKDTHPEAVYMKGTGKAIEQVLSLGLYFQNQEDCRIEIETYSVTVVDGIEKTSEDAQDILESDGHDVESENATHVPKARRRDLSGVQVAVYLKS